jgi:hypothetical protein
VYAARVTKRAAKTQSRRKSSERKTREAAPAKTRVANGRTAPAARKAAPRAAITASKARRGRIASPPAAAPSKKSPSRKIAEPREPGDAALDPRVAAVIALALRDAAASDARARELAEPPSAWTLAGRAARVQTRWTR